MHLDVLDLHNFYYRTQLGRVAQRAIRDKVVELWPPMAAQAVAGFGFAVPLLRPYLPHARRVIGLMPAPQGVMPWPAGEANVSVLCEDVSWPLATGMVDRLVLMHGLETTENPSALLDEVHRVLGPGGRALFIVPNRAGLWSRSDATPFGFGRPYSAGQLEVQLKRHGFTPERSQTVLHVPPSQAPFWSKRQSRSMPPPAAGLAPSSPNPSACSEALGSRCPARAPDPSQAMSALTAPGSRISGMSARLSGS